MPLRSLYSRDISNLFMAGRCHSATHIALGATRVMRTMCATLHNHTLVSKGQTVAATQPTAS